MYKLYTKRVIKSQNVDLFMGEFDSLTLAAHFLYGAGFLLDAYCIKDDTRYNLVESDYFDQELGQDCVELSFEQE
jgi:hypothetical protein